MNSKPPMQLAYHGTPYRGIERFCTTHVGAGEGAQSFGWGLYFASRLDVAEHYRRMLTRGRPEFRDDVAAAKFVAAIYFADAAVDELVDCLRHHPGAPAEAAQRLRAAAASSLRPEYRQAYAQLADLVESGDIIAPPRGEVYEVEVPADEWLLDWDLALVKQPPRARAALAELSAEISDERAVIGAIEDAIEVMRRRATSPDARVRAESAANLAKLRNDLAETLKASQSPSWLNMTGQEAYRRLASALGGDARAASMALHRLGVKGVKYLDGDSRGVGVAATDKPGHNYVIFDGADVIVRRPMYDGAPATAACPGHLACQGQQVQPLDQSTEDACTPTHRGSRERG